MFLHTNILICHQGDFLILTIIINKLKLKKGSIVNRFDLRTGQIQVYYSYMYHITTQIDAIVYSLPIYFLSFSGQETS